MDELSNANLSQEVNHEDHLEDLKNLRMDINQVKITDLDQFHFLNDKDRRLIYNYIIRHKPIIHVLELQSIEDLEPEKVRKLIPIFKVNGSNTMTSDLHNALNFEEWQGRLSLRWAREFPRESNFDLNDSVPSSFLGSADKMFLRFSINRPGLFSAGLISEKDAGEQWWTKSSSSGVDYLSAFIKIDRLGSRISNVILGDYRIRVGQGLVLDNSFTSQSLLDLGYFAKSSGFLKPYQSLQENNMLRGVAGQLTLNKSTHAILFYSKSKIDANVIESDGDLQEIQISSILNSGLHRTRAEILDRNALSTSIKGGYIKTQKRNWYAGLSFITANQDKNLGSDVRPDQVFLNRLNTQYFGSLFHQMQIKGALLFGEIAVNQEGKLALIQGLLKGLGKHAELMILHRNFSPSFNSRYSQVFSSTGKSQNEKGNTVGLNFSINKRCKVNLQWNSWINPWLKYGVDQPSEAQEFSSRISFSEKRKWTFYLQFTRRLKEKSQIELHETITQHELNTNLRFHAEVKLNPSWTWRGRIERHDFSFAEEQDNGYLVFSDFIYKGVESRISGNFRLGYHATGSYNSRIYTFENDLLYQFRIPAYFGKGVISYCNIRYRIHHDWMMELRGALHYRQSEDSEIKSHYEKEIKLQIHYTFN